MLSSNSLTQINVHDANLVQRFVEVVGFDIFNGGAHIHPLHDPAEHRVFVVQPRSRDGGDVELRTVGVRASVRHSNRKGTIVSQAGDEFVLKLTYDNRSKGGEHPAWCGETI